MVVNVKTNSNSAAEQDALIRNSDAAAQEARHIAAMAALEAAESGKSNSALDELERDSQPNILTPTNVVKLNPNFSQGNGFLSDAMNNTSTEQLSEATDEVIDDSIGDKSGPVSFNV